MKLFGAIVTEFADELSFAFDDAIGRNGAFFDINAKFAGFTDGKGSVRGLDEGFALEFANARPFETPVELTDLRERFGFEPPQSFLYAKRDLRKALKDEHSVVSH